MLSSIDAFAAALGMRLSGLGADAAQGMVFTAKVHGGVLCGYLPEFPLEVVSA